MGLPALQKSVCPLGLIRMAMCQPQREDAWASALCHAGVVNNIEKLKQIVSLLAGPIWPKALMLSKCCLGQCSAHEGKPIHTTCAN